MIVQSEPEDVGIYAKESFGLVVDELAESVVATEGTSRDEGASVAILWEYDAVRDRWREIGQIVSVKSGNIPKLTHCRQAFGS